MGEWIVEQAGTPAGQRLALGLVLFSALAHAVFGAMADKDIPGLLAKIAPLVDTWHLCALPNPRAAEPAALEALVATVATVAASRVGGAPAVLRHEGPAQALAAAVAAADPVDRIVVFGSFLTVGGVLQAGLPRLGAAHLAGG